MAVETLSANGNTRGQKSNSGKMIVIAAGTFGGGTASIQIEDEAGTWVNVSDGSGTADFTKLVNCSDFRLRVNLAGSTAPDLDVSMQTQEK